jgi:PKHD-type hydroxylase
MWVIPQELKPNESYIWKRDIFNSAELELITEIGKSIPMIEGAVDNKESPTVDARRSKISWIQPLPHTEFIFDRISHALNAANSSFYNYDLTHIEDLQFSEYDESYSGMYRNHTDDGFDSATTRKLSFTIQLSDPTEYDGGDLLLYRFKLDEPTVAQKEKGLLIAFPSFTIHEVTPVTKGTRYSLVGWAHGPRFR